MVQHFSARIKLNMLNGLGDRVFDGVKKANIPGLINSESQDAGKVVNWFFEWDEGWTNHDLYLVYHIEFDCHKAVRDQAGRWGAIVVNFFGMTESLVANSLRKALRNGFEKEMPIFGVIASLQHCDVIDGHTSRMRF